MKGAGERPSGDENRDPWQPRFGIGALLLAMAVCSVMFASASYLVPALRGERNFQFGFILFTLVSPILLMIVASGLIALSRWWRRSR